jgi:nucleoside-diphosphate-sugar epimerase
VAKKFKPDLIIHLAAILSATGEKNPQLAMMLNVDGFKTILDLAVEQRAAYTHSDLTH